MIEPGKVNGGYAVVSATDFFDSHLGVVLAHNPDAVQPWVTWTYNKQAKGFSSGHYFSDRQAAKDDYAKRVARGY